MHEVNDTVQEHSGMFGSMQSMIKVLTDYDHEKHSDEYVDFHKDVSSLSSLSFSFIVILLLTSDMPRKKQRIQYNWRNLCRLYLFPKDRIQLRLAGM